MVFLSPPHLASASRPTYAEAYNNILTTHRRSPLTSASSVIILVAPDVDALCAARMLADLFKQDDVMHRIIPVSGLAELERMRDELATYAELHTLILLNMGAITDLPSVEWFGEFGLGLTVHVIDSSRPQNLASMFAAGENAERIIIWDDGEADRLEEERKAWEALTYDPEPDSDEDSEDDIEEDPPENDDEDEGDDDPASRKRRPSGDGDRGGGKRRRLDNDENTKRLSREGRNQCEERLRKYYMSGSWHGQSASGTVYILANILERVDNDLLWFAILGLTYQYTTSRISRDAYERYHSIYYDEVARLNPENEALNLNSLHPDDFSIRATEELRFTLFRHWNLYDAMFHSSYVASKLGIWKERGRKRLTGLLAKMGFSIPQTQQPYSHMDTDLKQQLRSKLDAIAPEYGMVELSYPSFVRHYGFRARPLSAADAVEALSALLDVASGIRLEIEIEGTRGGGEWFGGGRVWAVGDRERWRDERGGAPGDGSAGAPGGDNASNQSGEMTDGEKAEVQWWVRNFWSAFDALDDVSRIQDALPLAMTLHRAIIRQGTSIIDKQDIKSLRTHRLVTLAQGPDLALFAHPGVLSRLAMWLVDALRDRMPGQGRRKRKSLPFVVACLREATDSYIIVGVTGALEFGDVRKNEFGLAFLEARERCNARARHGTFDTSVLEVSKADYMVFLEALTEAMDEPVY